MKCTIKSYAPHRSHNFFLSQLIHCSFCVKQICTFCPIFIAKLESKQQQQRLATTNINDSSFYSYVTHNFHHLWYIYIWLTTALIFSYITLIHFERFSFLEILRKKIQPPMKIFIFSTPQIIATIWTESRFKHHSFFFT